MDVYMGYAVLCATLAVIAGSVCAAVACIFGITNGGVCEPGRAVKWLVGGCLMVILLMGFGVQEGYINGVALSNMISN